MAHPLDPLDSIEIFKTSKIIKAAKPTAKGWIFNSIVLVEPPKASFAEALLKEETANFTRKSLSLVVEKGSGKVYEVVTNLKEEKVESFAFAGEGKQPALSPEDCTLAEKVAKNDENVQTRCKTLGMNDMSLVVADPWSAGYNGEPQFENKRVVQLFMYKRNFDGDNHYAHPLDFAVYVDLVAERVIEIVQLPVHSSSYDVSQTDGIFKVPETVSNYDPQFLPADFSRKDLKPLEIQQPEGPSFTVDGKEISWQKFKFRHSFNYREGLVLHDIRYQDGDSLRPLFYRMSLSEMVVPYGDPRAPFHRKCAFDLGEYGLGFCANSLKLGCDCVGAIKYFDGVINNHEGEPVVLENVICLHEEDAGTLHKHTEYRTGHAVVARSRRLVISFVATVVNYEYAFYWSFYQDGTINFEVKATGELSTNGIVDEESGKFGTIVFPNVIGQFHQHIFCMRIDPMVDGLKNSVATVDVKAMDGDEKTNPYNQGFTVEETVLKDSIASVTDTQPSTFRTWKIVNPSKLHPYTGKPVGWKLIPSTGSFSGLIAGPNSNIRKRAGFAAHSVWVTKHVDEELFAGGFYINQSKGGDGVAKWVERKEKIEDEDVVLWHSFGVTHLPRVEDFPIMPVESTGFTLKPVNFFKHNPGLDVAIPCKNKSGSKLA